MANTGWKIPSSFKNNNNVTSPGNMYSSDNNYADFTIHESYVTLLNFGIEISKGSYIDGIEISVEGYSSHNDHSIGFRLSWDEGSDWTNWKEVTTDWTTVEGTHILGANNDDWERRWITSDFSNKNFRVQVMGTGETGDESNFVDQVKVKVHYVDVRAFLIIAQSGYDAEKDAKEKMVFHSRYDTMKLFKSGSGSQSVPAATAPFGPSGTATVEITHGLGYEPAFMCFCTSIWRDDTKFSPYAYRSIGAISPDGGSYAVDTTKLYIHLYNGNPSGARTIYYRYHIYYNELA